MSTPLCLSADEQRHLVAAFTTLLSPLAYPDLDDWRRASCDRVRELLRADRLLFVLPRDGRADVFTDDFDPDIAEYPDWIDPVANALGVFERLCALGAGARPMLYDDMRAFYRSAYWNDYALRHHSYDSLTVSVPVGPLPTVAHHAQLIVNHDTPHGVRFGDHEVGIARLLLPALQTGTLTWLRLARARHAFTALVDEFTVGAIVFDADGTEVHRNPPAGRFLASDTGATLAAQATTMASALARLALMGGAAVPTTARAGQYVLRATLLEPDVAGRGHAVLVTVEAACGGHPGPEALRRFGLTAQQATVARLLAERRSTAEIAAALFISVHTVRRHTEQVLSKLGVARRTDIAAVVRQIDADGPDGR